MRHAKSKPTPARDRPILRNTGLDRDDEDDYCDVADAGDCCRCGEPTRSTSTLYCWSCLIDRGDPEDE